MLIILAYVYWKAPVVFDQGEGEMKSYHVTRAGVIIRNSRLNVFYNEADLKIFTNFTENILEWNPLLANLQA